MAGSPLSGGYAGAKATIRFITGYAADKSAAGRARHPFHLGAAAVDFGDRAGVDHGGRLPRREGLDVDEYLDGSGPGLTPEDVGQARSTW